jgi:hypothetical protein
MKNFSKNLLFILLFAIALMLTNTSCKDETDCKMEIIAKLDSDTTVLIPFARVNIDQGDIHIVGATDANGKYEHTRALEAILNVKVTDSIVIDSTAIPPTYLLRIGEGTIRLKPGETVRKTIFVK